MNTVLCFGYNYLKNFIFYEIRQNTIMENTEEIISRLKFIGHIQKEEKINTRQVNRQANNIWTKLQRTLIYPDNRTNTLRFLKDVITRTFEVLELQHEDKTVCKTIIEDLGKAKIGIINLRQTYVDDTKFCCDMDVLLETITTNLTHYKEKYPLS